MASLIIIEDDLSVRYLLQMVFKDAGHEVIAAVDNTDSALEYFKAGRVPDILCLDLILPGGSGARIIEQLRKAHPAMKIAMVTGLPETQVMRLVRTASYDLLIHKPFKTAELLSKINSLLDGPAPQ